MIKSKGDAFHNSLLVHLEDLSKYAQKLTRNPTEANDVVQEACRLALEKRSTYSPETNIRAWLFKIVHNTFIDMKRSQAKRFKKEVPGVDIDIILSRPDIVNQEDDIMYLDVVGVLNTLPKSLKEPCFLVFIKGYSYDEVGNILDLSDKSVKSRIYRGRSMLKDILLENNIASDHNNGLRM